MIPDLNQYLYWSVDDLVREETIKKGCIPARTIVYLAQKELIANPLDERSLVELGFLYKVWRKDTIIHGMLGHLPKKKRQRLVDTADLHTRWERLAYALFYKRACSPETFKDLTISRVAQEVERYIEIELDSQQYLRLKELKKKAQNAAAYQIRKEQKRSSFQGSKHEQYPTLNTRGKTPSEEMKNV